MKNSSNPVIDIIHFFSPMKMRAKYTLGLITWFIFLFPMTSQAQNTLAPPPQNTLGGVAGKGLDMNTEAYGYISEIPMSNPGIEGSSYLFDQWLPSKLDFGKGGRFEGLSIRYDLQNSLFYIRLKDKVKTISGSYVDNFSVVDSLGRTHEYVNCRKFKSDKDMVGFFEILTEGKYRLLRKTEVIVIRSNYVQALDLGERNDKLSQKASFYIASEDTVFKVPSSKKQLAGMFTEKEGFASYLKTSGANIHKVKYLKKLLDFMNQ